MKACEKLGVAPENAYAIEDSYNGIRAAYAGRLHPVMVLDLLPANEEIRVCAEKIAKDLLEVLHYFQQSR